MKNFKFYIVSILFSMLFFLPVQHLVAEEGMRGRGGTQMHGNQMHHNMNNYNGMHHPNLNGAGNGANSGTVINETPEVIVPASPQFNTPQH